MKALFKSKSFRGGLSANKNNREDDSGHLTASAVDPLANDKNRLPQQQQALVEAPTTVQHGEEDSGVFTATKSTASSQQRRKPSSSKSPNPRIVVGQRRRPSIDGGAAAAASRGRRSTATAAQSTQRSGDQATRHSRRSRSRPRSEHQDQQQAPTNRSSSGGPRRARTPHRKVSNSNNADVEAELMVLLNSPLEPKKPMSSKRSISRPRASKKRAGKKQDFVPPPPPPMEYATPPSTGSLRHKGSSNSSNRRLSPKASNNMPRRLSEDQRIMLSPRVSTKSPRQMQMRSMDEFRSRPEKNSSILSQSLHDPLESDEEEVMIKSSSDHGRPKSKRPPLSRNYSAESYSRAASSRQLRRSSLSNSNHGRPRSSSRDLLSSQSNHSQQLQSRSTRRSGLLSQSEHGGKGSDMDTMRNQRLGRRSKSPHPKSLSRSEHGGGSDDSRSFRNQRLLPTSSHHSNDSRGSSAGGRRQMLSTSQHGRRSKSPHPNSLSRSEHGGSDDSRSFRNQRLLPTSSHHSNDSRGSSAGGRKQMLSTSQHGRRSKSPHPSSLKRSNSALSSKSDHGGSKSGERLGGPARDKPNPRRMLSPQQRSHPSSLSRQQVLHAAKVLEEAALLASPKPTTSRPGMMSSKSMSMRNLAAQERHQAATKIQTIVRCIQARERVQQLTYQQDLERQVQEVRTNLRITKEATRAQLQGYQQGQETQMTQQIAFYRQQLEKEYMDKHTQEISSRKTQMLQSMEQDVEHLRQKRNALLDKHRESMDAHRRLLSANSSASATFEQLNFSAKGLHASNARLEKKNELYKEKLQEAAKQIEMHESEARKMHTASLEYQRVAEHLQQLAQRHCPNNPQILSQIDYMLREVLASSQRDRLNQQHAPWSPQPAHGGPSRRPSLALPVLQAAPPLTSNGGTTTGALDPKGQTSAHARRRVSFGSVHVWEFATILGDNPSVSYGCPIALDVAPHHVRQERFASVDAYAAAAPHAPRWEKELVVPSALRSQILRQAGYSHRQIVACSFWAMVAKKRRAESMWDRLLLGSMNEGLVSKLKFEIDADGKVSDGETKGGT